MVNNEIANAIRMLSVDAFQKSHSGDPGTPMGMAEVVWRRHLCHNPKNPQWVNRDRYGQSNGHGSMLCSAGSQSGDRQTQPAVLQNHDWL